MDLTNKTAVVTGGARGIGAAIAAAMAEAGAVVVIADVLDEQGESVADGLRASGHQARFVRLDVSDQAAWDKILDETRRREGAARVLVNNAAIQMRKRIDDVNIAEWRRLMSVNVEGVLFGIKASTRLMKECGGGSIINIASVSGLGASPSPAYGASKWAVRGLTKSAAFEYGKWGIRVNAVLPGAVATELMVEGPMELFRKGTPLERLATPAHIAAMAVFLASDAAAGITGQDFVVDAGFSAGQHPGLLKVMAPE